MKTLCSFRPARLRASRRALAPAVVLCGAVTALVLLGALSPRAAADDMQYSPHPIFKAGDVDHYKLVFHAVVNLPQAGDKETDIIITMLMKELTKEVKPDGTVTVTTQAEKASAKIGPQENDVTALIPQITETRDKQGKVTDVKIDSADNPFQQNMGAILQQTLQVEMAFYPPKPVKIGDSWSLTMPPPKVPDAEVKAVGSATLVGKEAVGNADTLKVTVVRDLTVSGKEKVTAHFDGTGNLNVKDGKIERLVGKSETTGRQIKKSDFTLTRVVGDEKAAP